MNTPPSTFELIRDIALLIFAAIGSFVALSGLRAWKIQLKGRSEYELAKRILKSVYALREAISRVRNPFVLANEMYSALKEKGITIKENEFDKWNFSVVFEMRWNDISTSLNDLRVSEIDAEVLWGKSISNSLDKLYKIVLVLNLNIQEFLQLNKREDYSQKHKDLLDKCKTIVYDRGKKNEPDNFTQKVNDIIKEIEDSLRKYLK